MSPEDKLRRFEELIAPNLASAYNLARWLVGTREDAEDIVQEACLRAYASLHHLRGDDARPWLLAIVRNASMTWLKRTRGGLRETELDKSCADQFPADGDPESLLLDTRDRQRVQSAVASLPSEFREAIVLRELEECSYKEIAGIAGIPIGTVMSRLSRARTSLRETLSSQNRKVALR